MASRILLADESLNAQRLWAQYLVELGYDVTAVSSGAAALERLRDLHPHLVIADSGLREVSGADLCAIVRQHPEWGRIPLILTLKAFDQGTEEELRAAGAAAVLRKPFSPAMLEKLVIELLLPQQEMPAAEAPQELVEVSAGEPEEAIFPETEPVAGQGEAAAPPDEEPVAAEPVELLESHPEAPLVAEAEVDVEAELEVEIEVEVEVEVEVEIEVEVEVEVEVETEFEVEADVVLAAAEPLGEDLFEAGAPSAPPVTAADEGDLLESALQEAALTAPRASLPEQLPESAPAPLRLRQVLMQYLSPALAEKAAAEIERHLPPR